MAVVCTHIYLKNLLIHLLFVCDGVHGIMYFTQDGKTALYVAAQEGHEDVVELLLKAKADPELKTKKVGNAEFDT